MSHLVAHLHAPNGVRISLPTGLFINNEFVKSSSGSKITSICPYNGEEIASVEAANEADVDRAVQAAKAAFEEGSVWRETTGEQRGALLHKLADLIEEHKHVLATIDTWDNGKPYPLARDFDITNTSKMFRYYAGYADRIKGQSTVYSSNKLAYTLRQPYGVCAQIAPWNFPLFTASAKIAPALAAGNVVVFKQAEQTPLSILYLANLFREAGFPPGVVNILNGYGKDAGRPLVLHPDVRKVSFTGSTAVGREIMKMASVNLKSITLETGGKSPLIVFHDADLKQAARWAYIGGFSNQGQACIATSRLLVHESVMDAFVKEFVAHVVATAKTGNPFSQDTTHGPQISQIQHDKILAYVRGAKAQGAKIELGGESAQKEHSNGKGFFFQPTVVTNVTRDMTIFNEEVFGPVLVVTPFKNDKEAILLANATEYGLAAAIFTRDNKRAHRTAAALEAGMVWVNSATDAELSMPFGGVKQSGIGREMGEAGIDSYLETKSVYLNLGEF